MAKKRDNGRNKDARGVDKEPLSRRDFFAKGAVAGAAPGAARPLPCATFPKHLHARATHRCTLPGRRQAAPARRARERSPAGTPADA